MAGSKPGVHVVQLKPISVPELLIKGSKFIKWDDDSTVGIPVTLKVDPKGYILYWRDQNKGDMDCLDISLIRDTRTGKYARSPKDAKVRDTLIMGPQDVPLEDKMVTICYGTEMTQLNWINFAANSKEVAQEWTNGLFQYATNLLSLNQCTMAFLEKCHTKLATIVGLDGKIPVKNIVRMFVQHKDDKKKVEKALEASHLPHGRNDVIPPDKFTFEDFLRFYKHLCGRNEVDKIFHELGAKKKPYLTVEQFVEFLNGEQRDPRLNEILYPYYDKKRAQAIINQFEPNENMIKKDPNIPPGHLSQEGFLRYLMSYENDLIATEKFDLSEDMDQPLAHYFINSSHNTYLTGHQLTSESSVEIYRQALLTGCRCVELDCWDGKGADEEPAITHGFTMCTRISFREVIEAIAESAFKVSDYPVILSFENHCSPKQQAKMAAHCRAILGDAVLADSLESHPLEPDVPLPSPAQLKRKVIIKNKKRHVHKSKKKKELKGGGGVEETEAGATAAAAAGPEEVAGDAPPETTEAEATAVEEKTAEEAVPGAEGATGEGADAEEESSSDSDSDIESDEEQKDSEKGTAGQEAEAGMEMSALVNYIQPTHFHTFELADKRNKSFECSSFVETQATALLKEQPVDFVNYNKRQISRIYPKGTRVDSSNYMPQIFWNAGCQLVALNFQTLDLAMMLNLGIFEYNGRSGYILKPDFMRRKDRHFDPFAESTVDGIIAGTVSIKVISGQFLSDKKLGTYVEVDMYGLPADTVRKKFRTKTIPGNAICPVWDEEAFVFKKVVLPNLATLRICVCDENGKLLGHRVIPVEGLRPGYRHIGLRNELNQPQNLATLFVHIGVKDYVPDAFADFAAALANPIAYQSALEKHAEQLAVLEEDFDAPDEEEKPPEGVTPKTPVVTEAPGGIDRKRNTSVISKKSTGPESTQLSRVGSVHDPVRKQESTISGVSQGSQGSALTTAAAGPSKSTSLPNSPMHAVNQGENGAAVKQPIKIDVSQTTRLKDPEVLEPPSIAQLKEMKTYVKLSTKMEKELDTLRKKMNKARNNMQEMHNLQEEKLLLSQIKSKTTVEKGQRKSMKRASKHGNNDDLTAKNMQEMSRLVSEQETKHRELKKEQIESLRNLCLDQYKTEHDLQVKYHPQLYDVLNHLMSSSHEDHLKKLDQIHDKEVADLKKKLDAQNREEMKMLAKKHKDKAELNRIKREAQQKHIQMAVQERQKLRDILEKRKEEVRARHDELKQELAAERETKKAELEADYKSRCDKLEEELKIPEAPKQESSQGEPSSPTPGTAPASAEQSASAEQKEQSEEKAPSSPSDSTKKEDLPSSDSEKDKTPAISQNGGENVKTDVETTPNGKVSTSDMQEKGNSGDNCELENDDALKSNGDVPSHQQAECVEGQEITKL